MSFRRLSTRDLTEAIPGIIVHGGAINPATKEFEDGVSHAALMGMKLLNQGKTSLEAVVKAVEIMENNPIFNAGTGSWPNLSGDIEMDAIVMDGKSLKAGAVACIKMVKNPILVARKIIDETDHILLAGDGAEKFARTLGFEEYDPLTPQRKAQWEAMVAKLRKGEELPWFKYWKHVKKYLGDTVGAVAIDAHKDISAATSSGGFPLKLPGRVGDVPLIGCSTYASGLAGVSITGHGEVVMKHLLAKGLCDDIGEGEDTQKTIENAVRTISREEQGNILLAIIAMDKCGDIGAARNVEETPHAYFCRGMKSPKVGFASIVR
jgi:beta-aspartyl-peptidase (threonine type)